MISGTKDVPSHLIRVCLSPWIFCLFYSDLIVSTHGLLNNSWHSFSEVKYVLRTDIMFRRISGGKWHSRINIAPSLSEAALALSQDAYEDNLRKKRIQCETLYQVFLLLHWKTFNLFDKFVYRCHCHTSTFISKANPMYIFLDLPLHRNQSRSRRKGILKDQPRRTWLL